MSRRGHVFTLEPQTHGNRRDMTMPNCEDGADDDMTVDEENDNEGYGEGDDEDDEEDEEADKRDRITHEKEKAVKGLETRHELLHVNPR